MPMPLPSRPAIRPVEELDTAAPLIVCKKLVFLAAGRLGDMLATSLRRAMLLMTAPGSTAENPWID